MKTFKDLEFKPHRSGDGTQAMIFFENGYGVSVVRFKVMGTYGSYTSNESEWELAIIKGTPEDCGLTYDSGITDDVMGHLTEKEVTDVMKRVQELKSVATV